MKLILATRISASTEFVSYIKEQIQTEWFQNAYPGKHRHSWSK